MASNRNNFIILTTPRSGSAWLISILNQIDNVTAYGELFIQKTRERGKETWDNAYACTRFIEAEPVGLKGRPFSIFSYLDTVYGRTDLIGFKLMYLQMRKYPELLAYFIMNRIRVIHLIRQNHLDVFISRAILKKTQVAHPLSDQPAFREVRIELEPKELLRGLRARERQIRFIHDLLRWCRLPHLEVTYENLVRDRSSFDSIWDFLSVHPGDRVLQSKLVKIQKREHADVISNYSEVRKALADTRFAPLIN